MNMAYMENTVYSSENFLTVQWICNEPDTVVQSSLQLIMPWGARELLSEMNVPNIVGISPSESYFPFAHTSSACILVAFHIE